MTPSTFRPAFFLPQLTAGGAERVVLALSGLWASRGISCDLITASDGGAWADRIPLGVRHVSLGARRPRAAIRALARQLRRERPSVLLSTIFPANVAASVAARIARVPCVVREANWTVDDLRTPGVFGTALNHIALRATYRLASRVVALTNGGADHLAAVARIPRSRIVVIPNPAFPSTADQPAVVRDPLHVVACGRLEPQKDFATLIAAFAIVAPTRAARLTILGEGSQRAALQAHIDHLGLGIRVQLAGYCADPMRVFASAGVFALSSRWEGFPNVVLEALAAGCRVVATDASDAVRWVLQDGRAGLIVPPGDIAALADALADALDGRSPPASPTALAPFALDHVAACYEAVLRDAAGST